MSVWYVSMGDRPTDGRKITAKQKTESCDCSQRKKAEPETEDFLFDHAIESRIAKIQSKLEATHKQKAHRKTVPWIDKAFCQIQLPEKQREEAE